MIRALCGSMRAKEMRSLCPETFSFHNKKYIKKIIKFYNQHSFRQDLIQSQGGRNWRRRRIGSSFLILWTAALKSVACINTLSTRLFLSLPWISGRFLTYRTHTDKLPPVFRTSHKIIDGGLIISSSLNTLEMWAIHIWAALSHSFGILEHV